MIDVTGIDRKTLVIELARALPGPAFDEAEANAALHPDVLETSSMASVWICGRKVYAMQSGNQLDDATYDKKAGQVGLAASVVASLR